MSRRSLKDLKEQLAKQGEKKGGNGGGFFYPHWKLPFDGEVRIRITEDPDMDNPFIVYREYLEHKLPIGGENVTIPCPKNNGKNTPCPICELSVKYYKIKTKESENKGKMYYRDAFVLLRGIIIEDGLQHDDDTDFVGVQKPFKLTYQMGNKLKAEMGKLEDETFWDLDEGLDFKIVKSKQVVGEKEYGKYDLASGFVRKSTSVPESYRAELTDKPLSDLIPEIPSYDEVDELLSKHLRELNEADDDGEDTNSESESDLMAKLSRNKAKLKTEAAAPAPAVSKKPAKTEEVVDDDNDDPPFDVDEDVTVFDSKGDDDDDDIDLAALLGDDDD